MSSSGAGRGRGWLNLAKNADAPRPVGLSRPLTNNCTPAGPPQLNNEYKELIDRIEELNLSDDGIMFNKKMHHIQSFWLQQCSCQEDVEKSFEALYNACLQDAELASKLVTLVASRTFITQEIHDCNLRKQFLMHLQRDFENSNQLQTTSPLMFQNCVHMIGEFYCKAKLSNGEPFTFLSTPFVSCLELLINSRTLSDLKLFTTQLYLNGPTLKTQKPEELSKLSIKIRNLLVTEPQLSKESKLWLLLALDLFNVRFGVLPSEIYKFYEDQLGSSIMMNFQRSHDTLSIQTLHSSKILDSYQSNVNVLQISTSPVESAKNDSQKFNNSAEFNNTQTDVPNKNKEKTGRPILGVGARFVKNKSSDEQGTWSSKHNNGGRSHNNKKGPPTLKSNKGWEHDDRFENDYD